MYQMRLHWFENQISLAEAEYAELLCSNGILAALRENDLRAYFVFKLKHDAYTTVISYKKNMSGYWHDPNDWIIMPDDSDAAITLEWELIQRMSRMGAVGC